MAEPADRGTRLAAAFLDMLVFAVMVYAPILLVVMVVGEPTEGAPSDGANTAFAVGMLLTLVGFGAWCYYTIKYVKENGQSIAKRMMKIKVIRTDGSPITLGRLFWMRNFVNGLLGIIPLYGLIDVLFIFGESRQCLHDKVADTLVVKA